MKKVMGKRTYHNSIMRYVEKLLQQKGYQTELDYLFPKIINGRNGRVDVIGIKKDNKIAIEVESSKRKKSKIKLEKCGFDTKIVILISKNLGKIRKQKQFYEDKSQIKAFTIKEFEKLGR